MCKLADILTIYDAPDKKGFYYFEVSGRIKSLPEEVWSAPDAQAELLGLSFQDTAGGKNREWSTYYGPMFVGHRNDDESIKVYNPDIKWVTEGHIAYWEKRAAETHNPLMCMRYAGLVFDFKKALFSKEPDFQTIKRKYIQSIIDVVNGEYYAHSVEGYYFLDRGFECAVALRQQDLIEQAKQALAMLDKKYEIEDKSPGLWGRGFKILLTFLNHFTDDEQQIIVQSNESRYVRLEQVVFTDQSRASELVHPLREQAELLCEYYEKVGDKAKITNLLDKQRVIIEKAKDSQGGMWYHAMLSQLQSLYRKYHLYEQANKLYVPIQNSGTEALNGMQKIEIPFNLDRRLIDKLIADAIAGTPQESIKRFTISNTPNMDRERQRQLEDAKRYPLMGLISTITYDDRGNPINKVGVGKEAEQQKFMYGLSRNYQISAVFMQMQINAMIEHDVLSAETLMDYVNQAEWIQPNHREIIKCGFEAYFAKNYLSACHLLIPQFEAAIRNIVSMNGGEILQADGKVIDDNRYISLEGLLSGEVFKRLFTEDEVTYLQSVFTDHNGWNLRNQISHGLMSAESFNNTMADRILHSYLFLFEKLKKEERW